MINWSAIKGFNWDSGNSRKNVKKHDVTQFEAEQVFFNQPLLITQDTKHSMNEVRFHALGKTDEGRLLHITFTLRDKNTLIRVISSRTMHRSERFVYGQI